MYNILDLMGKENLRVGRVKDFIKFKELKIKKKQLINSLTIACL